MSDDELDALVATLGETDWGPNVTDTMTRWDQARRKSAAAITTLRARIAALEADAAKDRKKRAKRVARKVKADG